MDFNSTVDLIIKDLNEAREIIDDFKNYPDVPLLQIELAKSKCKSASEVISLLKKVQVPLQSDEKKESIPVKPVNLPDTVEVISRIAESPAPLAQAVRNIDASAPASAKNTEPSIIADKFISQSDTLNDQLGSLKDDNDLHGSIKLKPITKLSDAIGVNDKFLFIRELFNGNPEAYNQAITKLDETAYFADAKAIIMSYTGENTESFAAIQLLDLVKRKFPEDE
jgi:hypothetical protein